MEINTVLNSCALVRSLFEVNGNSRNLLIESRIFRVDIY